MYLLQLEGSKLSLAKHDTSDVPAYAILSHTWGADTDELTFQDVVSGTGREKTGFAKVQFCGEQAAKDGLRYFWVDSCCIDKTSSSELSEAIVSMYAWYERSSKCYVYLQDVFTRKRDDDGHPKDTWKAAFQGSRWFTRGWTLQELLAPRSVDFFSRDRDLLGDKATLEVLIKMTTKIPIQALRGAPLSGFSVYERWRWAATRNTKREEDKAYCLLGIFEVSMQAIYGEGEASAFRRLQEAIDKRGFQHDSIFFTGRPSHLHNSGVASNPAPLGTTIEEQREALIKSLAFDQMDTRRYNIKDAQHTTCRWLLQHPAFVAWTDPEKSPRDRNILWINGKPGAGKSTLVKFAHSHARRKQKRNQNEILISFFFNARGDVMEKTTVGMYRSLLYQLLRTAPDLHCILDELDSASWDSGSSVWTLELLQTLFNAAVAALGQRRLVCFIDALDECNEQQVRNMVTLFEELEESAIESGTQLCICFASRHYPEVRIKKGLSLTLENEDGHSEDLKKFIHRQLEAGNEEDDERIRRRIQEKSNGVFMWAVLVIDILNREYRLGRMWTVERKLEQIPERLSELFRDILRRDGDNMDDLLLCLQWIVFSLRPLKPAELYFAMAAKLDNAPPGPWVPGTVTSERMARFVVGSSKGLAEVTKSKDEPTVQFIHESVRDFLVKDGGLCELWPHLNDAPASSSHDQLKQCCQRYLTVDLSEVAPLDRKLPKASSSDGQQLRDEVRTKYPFIEYASQQVFYHANEAAETMPQSAFLDTFDLDVWIHITNVLQRYDNRRHLPNVTLLYVLTEANCVRLMNMISMQSRWDRIAGERYGYPFLVAFAGGYRDALVALLSEDGPVPLQEIAKDPGFSKASEVRAGEDHLSWAIRNKNWNLAEHLLTIPRDEDHVSLASMPGGRGLSSLLVAAEFGPTTLVKRLVERIENINGRFGRHHETALFCAVRNNRDTTVQMLLHAGSDVNVQSETLQKASLHGNENIVQMLIDAGADVNARGGSIPPRYRQQQQVVTRR